MTTENKAVLTRDRGPDYLQRNIRMTQDQIDQARVLGAGNLSRGVRVAIQVASAVKSVEGKA